MTIQPLHDRVVIQKIEEENKTPTGIIIPDQHKEKPSKGKVIAIGEGQYLSNGLIRELKVKKDDIVLFGKYSGTEIKFNNESYLIMKEEEILGIIK